MESRTQPAVGHVLVGVDGSPAAEQAVRFAAQEAAARKAQLRILLVQDPAAQADSWANAVMQHAADVAAQAAPGITVKRAVATGSAAGTLIGSSDSAELLVIGHSGQSWFSQMLLCSVAAGVMGRTRCPVAVVGAGAATDRSGPVVVGVEGPPDSPEILEVAFTEAAVRGTGVLAVHAWRPAVFLGPAQIAVSEQVHRPSYESSVLNSSLDFVARRHRDVPASGRVVEQEPAKALLAASREACLLVVGSRGHGAVGAALLGSVSRELVRRASCPVIVVPNQLPARDPRAGSVGRRLESAGRGPGGRG